MKFARYFSLRESRLFHGAKALLPRHKCGGSHPHLTGARLGNQAGFTRGITTTCHQIKRRSHGVPARHANASAAVGEGLFGNLSSYLSIVDCIANISEGLRVMCATHPAVQSAAHVECSHPEYGCLRHCFNKQSNGNHR
jgi:hypothetical protein